MSERDESSDKPQVVDTMWAVYEAQQAKMDALRSQVAALRGAIKQLKRDYNQIELVVTGHNHTYRDVDEVDADVEKAITDTEAAAREYERELRNRVRDEIAAAFEAMGSGYEMFAPTAAQHVLDMKETP